MSFDQSDVPALPNFDLGTKLESAELHVLAGQEKDAYFRPQRGALQWAIDNTTYGEAVIETMYADELLVSGEFEPLAHRAESWCADEIAGFFAEYGMGQPIVPGAPRSRNMAHSTVSRMNLARQPENRHNEKAGRFDHVRPAIVANAQQVAAMLGRPARASTGYEVLSSDVSVIAPLVAQIVDGIGSREAYVRVVKLDISPVKAPTETRQRAAQLAGRFATINALPNRRELDYLALLPAARDIFRRSTRLVDTNGESTYAGGIALDPLALRLLAEYGTTADRESIIDVAINSDRAIPFGIVELIGETTGKYPALRIANPQGDDRLSERLRLARAMVWQGNDLAASDY